MLTGNIKWRYRISYYIVICNNVLRINAYANTAHTHTPHTHIPLERYEVHVYSSLQMKSWQMILLSSFYFPVFYISVGKYSLFSYQQRLISIHYLNKLQLIFKTFSLHPFTKYFTLNSRTSKVYCTYQLSSHFSDLLC